MKELFLPYELAVVAKDKGFNEPCIKMQDWNNSIHEYAPYDAENFNYEDSGRVSIPLYQQIIDWFREEHKIDARVFPMYETEDDYKTCWGYNILELEWGEDKEHHIANSVSTRERSLSYYEALNKAIEEAFKLIK